MSIYKKIIATAGLFVMAAASVIAPAPSASAYEILGNNTTTSSNNGYSYCTNPNGSSTSYVTDISGAQYKIGDYAYFYVIKNADKVNDTCPVAKLSQNFVPISNNHTTSFDLASNGAPTNVKIINTNPSDYKVACEGNDTVVTIQDKEQDTLSLSTVVKADDFTYNTSTESNGTLKIKFTRKDSAVKVTNVVDIYVSESTPTVLGYGQLAMGASVASATGMATLDATAKVVKISGVSIVSPNCDANLYTSSSMSSSSMSSSSSSMVSSSSKSSMVSSSSTAMTATTTDGKGSTVRTGGSN